MEFNESTKTFEAYVTVPSKEKLNTDSILLTVNANGFIEGEEFNDAVSFGVGLTNSIDFIPLILLILALFLNSFKTRGVPLAGVQALLVLVWIVGEQLKILPNNFDDYWLLNL